MTKSNSAGYEVESTTWDSAEIEEGIFLYGETLMESHETKIISGLLIISGVS